MKNLTIFAIALLVYSFAFGQESTKAIQKEIDQQVWKLFIESYNALDSETFNALHTDDVLRANSYDLLVGEEYKKQNREGFQRSKEQGVEREIEIRLDQRETNSDISYEVGYYRVTSSSKDKEKNFYGRFHVLMKKVDGQWKIAQDWDTDEVNGVKVTEADFAKAEPLKF